MRLRQLAADHDLAVGAQRASTASSSVSASRRGDSKKTHVRGSTASVASHVIRAECRRGAKPSKQNRSDGRPATASAVVTAEGPGRHEIGNPLSIQADTNRYPGSLIRGMPASLTSRTVAPAAISATSAGTRAASFWSYRLTILPAGLTSSAWARVRIRRVSSAATRSALARALTSRADASEG